MLNPLSLLTQQLTCNQFYCNHCAFPSFSLHSISMKSGSRMHQTSFIHEHFPLNSIELKHIVLELKEFARHYIRKSNKKVFLPYGNLFFASPQAWSAWYATYCWFSFFFQQNSPIWKITIIRCVFADWFFSP